jgi:N-acetyl-gamma-glutamyl-phosphate reductase
MIKAGIFGGTGYMGGEALRILLQHPEVEVKWATSRSGSDIALSHPNLYGVKVNLIKPEEAGACDVVFLALPTGESIEVAAKFLKMGCKVIDLGAAFRLKDRSTWETVYSQKHPEWDLVKEAIYGISELHQAEIKKSRLIANPGCFASAAILGLAPLVKEKIVDIDKLVVDGLSGTAGVGAELSRAAHHPEIANNLVPYNVVGHRHTFEMEQELSLVAEKPVSIHFTPTYVPIVRGVLDICHGFMKDKIGRQEILNYYRSFYADQPFVKVYDLPKEEKASWQYRPYPWVSSVAGTNNCYIGLDVDEKRKRIVVFSVLDSIGKGGAQAGIENMNLMFGLPRTTGLTQLGLHPH